MPSTGERLVKYGDTLSRIARENKPAAVNLDQMLVALFNSNRDAFDGNNMNRLRAGKILQLPDPSEVAAVDASEARKLIVAQVADFNAYRRSLASAASMAPATETQPQQQAAGKIKPQVESKAPPAPTKDKLEVSPTEAAKSAKTAGSMSKSALEEELIARDKALREASGRIAELEKNLENLKHLVELKSQAGVQVQQQAQTAFPKSAEVKKPEPAPAAKPASEPVPPPVAMAKPADPAVPAAAGSAPAEEKAAGMTAPAPAATEAVKPAEPAIAPAAPPKPAVKKPAPPLPPPPEPSFIEDNPELVFGGGGLIALLLGYLGFSAYRRKKQVLQDNTAQRDEPGAAPGGLGPKSAALVGAASESVDSGDVSIQGDFSEGGVLTTAESVDPVAEADVYMAYGRDSQAEEILLEGLKTDPTRTAIHLKLLELYANRKSVPQFESVANELHGLIGGKGPEWDKAAKLAASLGVTGGLFAVAAAAADPVAPAATMAPAVAAETVASPAAVPAEEDAGSFDFDLDLGTASAPAISAERVSKQAIAEEAIAHDFDFDLGLPTQNPPPEVATEAATVDSNSIDFPLDAGSSAESTAVAPKAAAGNEIDFDLDLGSAQAAAVTAAVEKAVSEPRPDGIDFNFDLELGNEEPAQTAVKPRATAAAVGEAPTAHDLAEINFDLGEPETAASKVQATVPDVTLKPAAAMSVADTVSQPATAEGIAGEADDSEVATKLELALAYEEMGDREGARELLNEVLNEGSPAQQGQARARLDQLDL
jgi:pilus assembly protein FimV